VSQPTPHETPLLLIVPDDRSARVGLSLEPIFSSWPSFSPRPTVVPIAPDVFCAKETPPASLGAIVAIDGLSPETDLGAVHSRLWDLGLPAVVLADLDDGWADRLSGQGVIVLERGTAPGVAAAVLASLAERERSVGMIRNELRTARRYTSGISRVMDQLHDELRLAGQVQRELMPTRMPALPDMDVGVVFRSAGYVSGDIYDVRRIDEDRTSFFVADASGHGVPAALMTMIIARGLRLEPTPGSDEGVPSPSAVLRELNDELVSQQGETARFATAVCGMIHHGARRVTIAGAGHPPPLVIGPDGRAEPVITDGGMLGVFSDEPFSESTVTLGPEDMLVLYTDGFDVAFPDRQADGGLRRLPTENYIRCFHETAGSWREGTMDDALGTLERSLDFQLGSLHQADDLTALLIAPKRPAGEAARAA
jgi:sigma-B regulation protein RsbU (phosphoserine phosphatase)